MTVEVEQRERLYHSPLGLYPFQVEGVVYAYERPDNLAVWDTGTGKALRNDQRVVTPEGWAKIADLRVGDRVMGADGLPHRVVGVYPQGVRPMWKVTFGDGAEVVCDSDHLWQVEFWGSTREYGKQRRVRRTRVLTTAEIAKDSRARAYSVPLASPVEYPPLDLPIDPYTLGALIGDGGLTQGTPRLVSGDHEVVSLLRLPPGVEIRETFRGGAWTWRFVTQRGRTNPLLDSLRALGVCVKSEFKRIPDPYLRGSVAQRLALLQGLLDTDGHCGDSIEFYTSSAGLADDVAELARSLGGTARIRVRGTTHLESYTVRIVLPQGMCPFRLTRKRERWSPRRPPYRKIVSVERVEPDEATCIRVDAPDALFLTEGYVVTHNSHLAMATAAMLFEDGLIDHTILVCERNKVEEWIEDFGRFTSLEAVKYHGNPAKREKIRKSLPQVVVSTYETLRNDAAVFPSKRARKLEPGPFTAEVMERRVLVVFDEMTKLGNRTSQSHKALDHMVQQIREHGECRVLGLTATPIERSPENIYNLGRILIPNNIGTVAQFERDHVSQRDIFGNATRFKNLTRETARPGVVPFAERLQPIMLRKRKTDPDVLDQFPKTVEEFSWIDLSPKHLDFYRTVRETFRDGSDETDRLLFGVLRQIVAHPLALVRSQGEIARQIVDEVGEAGLRAIGSQKLDRLGEYLVPLVHGQGAQVVVFTFFGPSIIPILSEALQAAEMSVATYYGAMHEYDRNQAMKKFKEGRARVLLSSDAGARGINLPEARYVVEYEMSLTHANRIQRLNRIHRIDSNHPSVTFQTFIAKQTVEEGIAEIVLRRNAWSDDIIDLDVEDADAHVTADVRRRLMYEAKKSS